MRIARYIRCVPARFVNEPPFKLILLPIFGKDLDHLVRIDSAVWETTVHKDVRELQTVLCHVGYVPGKPTTME